MSFVHCETQFLAINYFDRYSAKGFAANRKPGLIAAVALFIAAKLRETETPSISLFLTALNLEYTEKQFKASNARSVMSL